MTRAAALAFLGFAGTAAAWLLAWPAAVALADAAYTGGGWARAIALSAAMLGAMLTALATLGRALWRD